MQLCTSSCVSYKRVISLMVFAVFGFLYGVAAQEYRPVRMPAQPAWSVDITDELNLLPGESPQTAVQAQTLEGVPHGMAISRTYRLENAHVKGGMLVWGGRFRVPEEAGPQEALVLSFDESRVITGIWLNGKPLDEPDNTIAWGRWCGGEGIVHLPPLKPGTSARLVIACKELTQLYPNAFGRVRLRPATLSESISFVRPSGKKSDSGRWDWRRVRVVNRSRQPQVFEVDARQEDFFGTVLHSNTAETKLAAGQRKNLELEPAVSEQAYKLILSARQGDRTTFPYWDYHGVRRYNHVRPEVKRLAHAWQYQPVSAEKGFKLPVSGDGWEQIKLPHTPAEKEYNTHRAWYRRKIRIPKDWQGQCVQLFFQIVRHKADIYVDGNRIATREHWQTPARVDITSAVTPGQTHTLLVGITDFVAVLAPGVKHPDDGVNGVPLQSLTSPVPTFRYTFDGSNLGIPCVPELLAMPPVRTDWAFIRTHVTGDRRIEATLELQNDSGADKPVLLKTRVLHRGEPVLTVAERELTLRAGERREVEVQRSWENPVLWRPENPHLYEMRIELHAGNGEILDVRRERFGFREFGIEGRFFTLNGQRFHLYGSSHTILPTMNWPVIPTARRIIRQHSHLGGAFFQAGVANNWLADERGLLLKDENREALAFGKRLYAFHLPQTWERFFSEMRAIFRSRPNNPSTVMWDIGNEIDFSKPEERKEMARLYRRLRETDPTRLVTNSGGSGIPPGIEMLDTHQNTSPDNRWVWWFTHPAERPGYLEDAGLYSSPPATEDPERWQPVEVINDIHGNSFGGLPGYDPAILDKLLHVGGRPLFFSESLNADKGYNANFAGQVAWRPIPEPRAYWRRRSWVLQPLNWSVGRRLMIQFHRQAETAGFIIHVDRALTRALSPLAVFAENRHMSFAAGEPARMTFTVHNDRTFSDTVNVRWRLQHKGETIDSVRRSFNLGPAEIRRTAVKFDLPAVNKDCSCQVLVRARSRQDDAVFRDWVTFSVLQTRPLKVAEGYRLAVYDPEETVADYLAEAGLQSRALQTLNEWSDTRGTVLMIGSDALNHASADQKKSLRKAVHDGGQVIVLDHNKLPRFLDFSLSQEVKLENAAAKPDPHSAATRGMIQEDFVFWRTRDSDFAVHRNPFKLPAQGNFRPHLLTNSRVAFFDQTPLVEVREGRGRALFCQLNLRRALGVEPVARRVLANLLKWPERTVRPVSKKTALIGDSTDPVLHQLRGRYGVKGDIIEPDADAVDWSAYELVLVSGADADAGELLSRHADAIRSALEDGMRLVVFGLDLATGNWLRSITGKDVGVELFPHNKAYLRTFHPLNRGLTHDLFLLKHTFRPTSEPLEKKQREQVGHYRVVGDDVQPLLKPAYLAVMPVGSGEVIVNQVRAFEYPDRRFQRVVSQLLNNCGAQLHPGGLPMPTDNAPQWEYFTIDLRGHANRGFVDDPEKTPRGWSAQGPDFDMRDFPVGRQVFNGVPFDIIDPAQNEGRGVVALSGTTAVELTDTVKEIPVRHKAERLYFLHSAAWGGRQGGPRFFYRIWYEGREDWIPTEPKPVERVTVEPGENIHDWYHAGRVKSGELFLPGADIAWTGYTKHSRKRKSVVGVYMMEWTNPHPEKEIVAIDIVSPGKKGQGQPFVIAITGAVSREGGKGEDRAGIELSRILPDTVNPEQVHTHFQNGTYGLVLLKSGVIPVLHDNEGRPLFTGAADGYFIQGVVRDEAEGRPVRFPSVERQKNVEKVSVSTEQDKEGNAVFLVEGRGDYIKWTQKVKCFPVEVRITYDIEIRKPFPQGESTNVLLSLEANPALLPDGKLGHEPGSWPIAVPFTPGPAFIKYDRRLKWFGQPGYQVRAGHRVRFKLFEPEKRHPGNRSQITYSLEIP